MTRSLRLLLVWLPMLPLLLACSGPDETRIAETETPTVAALSATPTSTATATVEPSVTATATSPATPSPAATGTMVPSQAPPTATATATPEAEPTPLGQSPPPAYVPDPRPVDQQVTLPDIDTHYQLDITEINVDTGFVQASQTITIREFREPPPEQLMLQVVPAGYGFFTLDRMALNGQEITPGTLNDGFTLVVDLPQGIQAPAELAIEFHLNVGIDPTGWGYSMLDADVLRLGYWYPAISDDHSFGDLLDPSYTRVSGFDVSVTTEPGMPIAHTGDLASEEPQPDGRVRYSYSSTDTRDFALVLSRSYQVVSTISATGVAVEYYWRSAADGGLSAEAAEQRRQNVLFWTADAVDRLSALLGPYPYSTLRIVDAGPAQPAGIEFAMLIYIAPNYPSLDRLIYHEVAHQWLYAIIGTRTQIDGWVDEGGAEFFERGLPTDFAEVPPVPAEGYLFPLDAHQDEIEGAGRNQGYFSIYEQGARFYYDVMSLMGWDAFWAAMTDFYERFRFEIATAYDLLALWQRHSDVDLRPLYRETFRYEWIDNLADPGVEIQQGWVPILSLRSTAGADRN
ncbi:MAG: hypothetical protein H0V47_14220 [Chloroflexia bacterium]|nr:hypothetical protein [Chloroflexia bacterium]